MSTTMSTKRRIDGGPEHIRLNSQNLAISRATLDNSLNELHQITQIACVFKKYISVVNFSAFIQNMLVTIFASQVKWLGFGWSKMHQLHGACRKSDVFSEWILWSHFCERRWGHTCMKLLIVFGPYVLSIVVQNGTVLCYNYGTSNCIFLLNCRYH